MRNRGSEERRLRLIHRLRLRIRRISSLLKPVLQWRILIEQEVRKLQGKNILSNSWYIESKYKCSRNASLREDLLFGNFVVSLYYLSLLKHLDFNPDRMLRISIEWARHPEANLNSTFDHTCLWKYGMDSEFISKALQKHDTRATRIERNIDMYFEYSAVEKCYVPRAATKDNGIQVIEFLQSQNDIKKCFEKSLKYRINL